MIVLVFSDMNCDLLVILSYLIHTVSYAARFAVVVFCNYYLINEMPIPKLID